MELYGYYCVEMLVAGACSLLQTLRVQMRRRQSMMNQLWWILILQVCFSSTATGSLLILMSHQIIRDTAALHTDTDVD